MSKTNPPATPLSPEEKAAEKAAEKVRETLKEFEKLPDLDTGIIKLPKPPKKQNPTVLLKKAEKNILLLKELLAWSAAQAATWYGLQTVSANFTPQARKEFKKNLSRCQKALK